MCAAARPAGLASATTTIGEKRPRPLGVQGNQMFEKPVFLGDQCLGGPDDPANADIGTLPGPFPCAGVHSREAAKVAYRLPQYRPAHFEVFNIQ